MLKTFPPKDFKNWALVREIGQLEDVFSSTVNAAITMRRSCTLFLSIFVTYVKNAAVSKKKVLRSDQRFESCPTSQIFYAYFHREHTKNASFIGELISYSWSAFQTESLVNESKNARIDHIFISWKSRRHGSFEKPFPSGGMSRCGRTTLEIKVSVLHRPKVSWVETWVRVAFWLV